MGLILSGDHLDRGELTPADLALLLSDNWSALNGEHRVDGCLDWFCGGGDLAEALAALELHQVQMVLRAAMERLTPHSRGGR